jgi:FlaA1/EpsC-like NDP-sugar epimerase
VVSEFIQWFDLVILERIRLHALTFLRDALVVVVAFGLAEAARFDGHVKLADRNAFVRFLPVVLAAYMVALYVTGVHRRIWLYANSRDTRAMVDAAVLAVIVIGTADFVDPDSRPLPFSVVIVGTVFALIGLLGVRRARSMRKSRKRGGDVIKVLIVGAGQGGQIVAAELNDNPDWNQAAVGFLDDDSRKQRRRIQDVPVLGTVDSLPEVVRKLDIDTVAVAIPSLDPRELSHILSLAQETTARIQILSSPADVLHGEAPLRLRDINLDDLLDRVPSIISAEDERLARVLSNRVVLVTGAAGSIGSELCRQIVRFGPALLLALDNNESGLFALERELTAQATGGVRPVLGDITNAEKLFRLFETHDPDLVFHAAAYKHVPMLEMHPEEAAGVNVIGTLNLCKAALNTGVGRFVFVSTDKAVDPVNVLGHSKRIGEMIVRGHHGQDTVFCGVRFGNVMGSRGSALPEFIRQIDEGGPVTVTHPDVERYFMTIPEAVSLVIQAGAMASGGEMFMLDMGQPIRIVDLVRRIIRLRGLRIGRDIEIVYTGLRPGEKLTESLLFSAEASLPTDHPTIYVVSDLACPLLAQLEQDIALLWHAVAEGRSDVVRAMLEDIALGGDEGEHVARISVV